MQASTVKYSLAGIRQAQIQAGHLAPNWEAVPRLGQISKGIARHRAEQGPGTTERDPITPEHMRVLRTEWIRQGERGTMLWAVACMCFLSA